MNNEVNSQLQKSHELIDTLTCDVRRIEKSLVI